jgi:gliding motility-associated-like protein
MPITTLQNFSINNVQINEVAPNNNTIIVTTNNLPPSNYQFALDNGAYQNNNTFLNVADGVHLVKIRDIDNCLEGELLIPIVKIYAANLCFGDQTQFTLTPTLPPASKTVWNFNDPNSSASNTSSLYNPTHIFSNAGNYLVSVTVTFGIQDLTFSQNITIHSLPLIVSPVTLYKCDDNLDGFETFNLTDANALISNQYQSLTFTYFPSENDAILNTNPITNPTLFSNSTSPVVWVKVVNSENCFSIAQVNLVVESIIIPSNLQLTFNACDDLINNNDSDGITTFNFSSATSQIAAAINTSLNLEITYYQNLADALTKQYAINPTNYRNFSSPFQQQIAVRVENTLNGCFGIGYHINLTVDKVPQFDLKNTIEFCFLTSPHEISVENPLTDYTYTWEDNFGNTLGNSATISISNEGRFFVTATDYMGNNCIKTKSILVTSQEIIPFINFTNAHIVITDNSNNNTITIITDTLPDSQYEFAIDNGDFSSANFYDYVAAGRHMVRIRDIINCLESAIEVSLIGIPNFFTPNNDGYNDTWHVTGIDFQPNSNVYIFDRFGKLIKILDPLGPGWDGYYKGNPLPSTDYWYKVELEDGRTLKGHFSLIRR